MNTKHKKSPNVEDKHLECEECNKENEPNGEKTPRSSTSTEHTHTKRPKKSTSMKQSSLECEECNEEKKKFSTISSTKNTKKSSKKNHSEFSEVTEPSCQECVESTDKKLEKKLEKSSGAESEETGSLHGKGAGKKTSSVITIEETTVEASHISEEETTRTWHTGKETTIEAAVLEKEKHKTHVTKIGEIETSETTEMKEATVTEEYKTHEPVSRETEVSTEETTTLAAEETEKTVTKEHTVHETTTEETETTEMEEETEEYKTHEPVSKETEVSTEEATTLAAEETEKTVTKEHTVHATTTEEIETSETTEMEEETVTEEYKTHEPVSKETEVSTEEATTLAAEETEKTVTKEHRVHVTETEEIETSETTGRGEETITEEYKTHEPGSEKSETSEMEETVSAESESVTSQKENETKEILTTEETSFTEGTPPQEIKKSSSTAATEPFLITLEETEPSSEYPTEETEETIPAEVTASEADIFLMTAIEETNVTENVFVEESSTRSNFILPKPSPEPETNKTLVIIVNNSGKKMKKINESILEKLVNKKMQQLDLEYIDLHDISKAAETTNKTEESDSVSSEHLLGDGKNCKATEFMSNVHCPCDVDEYLKYLQNNLDKNVEVNNLNCTKMISFHDGFVITNKTEPTRRKKRSLSYLKSLGKSSNVIESSNIEDVLDKDYQIKLTGTDVPVYPNRKAKIYCGTVADKILDAEGTTFKWEFTKDGQETSEILPFSDNPLVLSNADTKTAGNYSCTRTNKNGEQENHNHELELITFPIYKIKLNMFYWVNDSCSLSDGDILFSYLPNMVGPLLCGTSGRLCKVDLARPRCISEDDGTFYNVTLTVTMNDIYDIYSTISDEKCNLNCRFKTYANLVYLVNKNAQVVKNIPVFSRTDHNLDFLSNVTVPERNKPPKIITTCRGGYGIEKFKQRICVMCPKHTFSADEEVYCKMCPAGQYQPQPGLQSCIPCKSPVDDAMCLRMLYSDTKIFKIYVGVAFGFVILIIAAIIFWNSAVSKSSPKVRYPNDYSYKPRSRRRIIPDEENPLLSPLMKTNEIRRNSPPAVPPPDF